MNRILQTFTALCSFALFVLAAPTQGFGQFLAAPASINFGTLQCSTALTTTTIVIQNTGVTTLILSGAAISPSSTDFSIISPTDITSNTPFFINPSITQAIVIAYNPQRIGAQNAALVLASNAVNATGGINSIPITSQRDSAGFTVSTTNIVLNNLAANTPTTTTITLLNTGSVPYSLPAPQFSGAFALDSLVPSTIAPNTTGRVFVRFFGAPAGVTTATTFNLADGCGRVTAVQVFAVVQAPPAITSFAPNIGTAGTRITITGTNLSGATAVFFGGVQAQSFTVNSPTQLTATLGQGASGAVFISVGGGAAISAQEFRFIPQPSVLFFTPSTGGTGTAVTIIGTNLENVLQVRFGAVLAQSFTIDSPTQITAIVGTGGQSGTIVASTQLSATTSTQRFTYIPQPNILFITPQTGAAGTVVTIIGNNLANARAVSFGGIPAQSFTQVSPTQIIATVGAEGASGLVSVGTPGGASASQQAFTFLSPPTVTFVSPTTGVQGAIVNIIGTNFTNVTGVSFGGVPAQNFVVSSPSQIIATVGVGGSGNITISTQSGSTTASQQFVYAAQPVITFFSPSSGVAGTTVNIFGTFFSGATTVNFGGIPARSFFVVSPTQITAVIGDQGATGNLAVVTPSGAGFSQNAFMFIPRSSVNTSSDAALTLRLSPNPVQSAASTLHYTLAEPSPVKIELFTMLGERVITIAEEVRSAGAYSVEVSTENLAQGMYVCRIQAGKVWKTALLQVIR
jgi:IPT/TIG domain